MTASAMIEAYRSDNELHNDVNNVSSSNAKSSNNSSQQEWHQRC